MRKKISVGELISKYRTKAHFTEAYESKGKVIPDGIHLGWNYIKQIISGEKLLLNQVDLEGFHIPPRLHNKA